MDSVTAKMIAVSEGRTQTAKDVLIAYQLTASDRMAHEIGKSIMIAGGEIAISICLFILIWKIEKRGGSGCAAARPLQAPTDRDEWEKFLENRQKEGETK